ncbi:MAG: 16S rRNA (guanine(527)-N(7))-methyltransferase RsmG [Eggerthellaceae bacterium]|nr:16S rRNA (guanine(527)-N(7))-methyltransferase RsmG [Eggerthellaceae bacterium]
MDKQQIIENYLDEILIANQTTNLTRITSRESALVLHLEDSLVGLQEINEAPEGLYGDLGTGGGFPGVPIAVMTGRDTLLIDSVQKKVKILQEIVDKLGISGNISTYGGRIEDLAIDKPQAFSVLSARALSRLVSLLELSAPLLKIGGRLVCYKAQIEQDELKEAFDVQELVGMRLMSRRSVTLSDGCTHREIIVFEKYKKPSMKLPRRVGLAQRNPLKPRK